MSILRCFVHWYVWWGRNAFYYYGRPFVWFVEWFASAERARVALERQILKKADTSLLSQVAAFQRDVAVAEREYRKALREEHRKALREVREAEREVREAEREVRDAEREVERMEE